MKQKNVCLLILSKPFKLVWSIKATVSYFSTGGTLTFQQSKALSVYSCTCVNNLWIRLSLHLRESDTIEHGIKDQSM